jgi:adenine-specific DNA-methyltransferase
MNVPNRSLLGQYFTTNEELKNKVLEFVMNEPEIILEPSVGQGDLVQIIYNNTDKVLPPFGNSVRKIEFDMYEIDTEIKMLEDIPKNVIYGDFLEQDVKKRYKTIIGNPPYVRTKNGNLYIEFIEKCYNLLVFNGELIFIIPSDFFKLTSASKLLNNMITNGTFTHIFHPHNEKLFENASIDVIVFRYCKNNKLKKEVIYNNEFLYISNNEGFITFNKNNNIDNVSFKEYFDIYVGLVSGKESVYKNKEHGNIEVLNGENKIEKYIFIEEFPSNNKKINEYLCTNKDELISRKIRKFNEKNWFEWGAPRNIKTIKEHLGEDCIYIYNLTRHENIAFKGNVRNFGGGLIILIPKQKNNNPEVLSLDKVISYLNSDDFKRNFMFSGRFKIGHRQISNSYIPEILK